MVLHFQTGYFFIIMHNMNTSIKHFSYKLLKQISYLLVSSETSLCRQRELKISNGLIKNIIPSYNFYSYLICEMTELSFIHAICGSVLGTF